MEHSRDEETEAILGDIIANGRDEVASFLLDSVGQLEERGEAEGYVHDGFGPLMPVQEEGYFMMDPVTQWRYKKETVLTAPVTEPSPARYIYIS